MSSPRMAGFPQRGDVSLGDDVRLHLGQPEPSAFIVADHARIFFGADRATPHDPGRAITNGMPAKQTVEATLTMTPWPRKGPGR